LVKSRLCRALACLGIKPSVFQILVTENRVDEIEELLKNAMIQMNEDIQERNVLGNHLEIPEKLGIKVEKHISMKNYIPYVNRFADLPTILEAYQYLMKRYVTNARERKRKWIKAKNTSTAISAFKKAQSSRGVRSLKAQCSKELKFMEPDQNHADQQHHKKNIAETKRHGDSNLDSAGPAELGVQGVQVHPQFLEDNEIWQEFMSEQTGTEIFARFKKEPIEILDDSDSDSSDKEPPLTFKVRKESAQLTRTILEQFNHLNMDDPMSDASKSRKNSYSSESSFSSRRESVFSTSKNSSNDSSRRTSIVTNNTNIVAAKKKKVFERRKSLIQIQKKGAFQPKEEEKLLLEYRKSARRPSSFF